MMKLPCPRSRDGHHRFGYLNERDTCDCCYAPQFPRTNDVVSWTLKYKNDFNKTIVVCIKRSSAKTEGEAVRLAMMKGVKPEQILSLEAGDKT